MTAAGGFEGTCALCRGCGALLCMSNGRYEWWPCQACGGAGVRAQFSKSLIRMHQPPWPDKEVDRQIAEAVVRAALPPPEK